MFDTKLRRILLYSKYLLIGLSLQSLPGCSPVKLPQVNQYSLDSISTIRLAKTASRKTLLIANPKAASGYDNSDMLYVTKPFQLESFAKNEWVAPPAEMLGSVLAESLQNTGYFRAVVATPYTGETDYRLNATLIELKQNFLHQPSQIQMTLKVDILDSKRGVVIASKRFHEGLPTTKDTPYGGVLAANKACRIIMQKVSKFVVMILRKA